MAEVGNVWVICLALGLIWVIVQFWSRFNEPTRTAKLEHFKKYAPRFATREREFMLAQYCYVGLIAGLYVAISISPQLVVQILHQLGGVAGTDSLGRLLGLDGDLEKIAGLNIFPLVVATVFTGAGSIRGLKDVEFRIRSLFHAVGKIPESVQSTVGQLKSSTFDFRSCCNLSDTETDRIGEAIDMPSLSVEAIMSDDVLRAWCIICCLTDRLQRIESGELAIRDDFLKEYRRELDEIVAERDELAPAVLTYAGQIAGDNDGAAGGDGNGNGFRTDVRQRVRNLRERLFVFLACGFRSSVATDSAVANGLRELGFQIRVQPAPNRNVATLIGAVSLYLILMTFVTAYLAREFHGWMGTDGFDPALTGVLMVPAPEQDAVRWLWTLTSGLFSLVALTAAFAIRRGRLNRRDWFHFDWAERRRPIISRYPWTAILSGLAGIGALFVVNIVMGYFFGPPEINETVPVMLWTGFVRALPWTPLAVTVALASLHVVDDDYLRMPKRKCIGMAATWSGVVGLVGGWTAFLRASANHGALERRRDSLGEIISELNTEIARLEVRSEALQGSARGLSSGDSESMKNIILKKAELRELSSEQEALTEALPTIADAMPYAALLIGLLILIQTVYMIMILQTLERSAQLSGNLTGCWLNLRTSTGDEKEILLVEDGALFVLDEVSGDARRVGRWVQYPECQVLHWDLSLPFGRKTLSGRGLLERESGVIVYTDQSDGDTAGEFVAQGSFTERRESIREIAAPQAVGG